jgi:hypothetical protein
MKYLRAFVKLRPIAVGFACGLALLLFSGCQTDEIQSYTVPRTEAAKREMRTLAAIVPHGDKTWYFKLVGSPQEVGAHKEGFRQFVQSSRFNDKSEQPLTWAKIPENWRRESKSEPRYATFHVDSAPSLELTVTPLGRESGSVFDNVQRWRGQLGLPPITESELPKMLEEVKVGDTTARFVDMTGMASARNKMGAPPFARGQEVSQPRAATERASPLKYTKPASWVESQAEMSVVAFRVASGDQSAKITVTRLAGQAGGLVLNVNRWRNQIGLGPASEAGIRTDVRKIEIAGVPGDYVALTGPESSGSRRQAILAVLFEHDSATWFVKMIGNAELVNIEKLNFESFVKSVQFAKSDGSQ